MKSVARTRSSVSIRRTSFCFRCPADWLSREGNWPKAGRLKKATHCLFCLISSIPIIAAKELPLARRPSTPRRGAQYFFDKSIDDLVRQGILKEIP